MEAYKTFAENCDTELEYFPYIRNNVLPELLDVINCAGEFRKIGS
jgi:hypothetical protein